MDKNKFVNIVVLGASGYTGSELIRILSYHPKINIVGLSADRNAGKFLGDIFPHLSQLNLPKLKHIDELDFNEDDPNKKIDVVFSALPSGEAQVVASKISQLLIDLSADFRLNDKTVFKEAYGFEHQSPEKQSEAVYGLTELSRNQLSKSNLVANPGCYPTSVLIPLIPLVRERFIDLENIIIDSKSGVSGAGRSLKESSLFTEVSEGIHAYGLGTHRHAPEIEQQLSNEAGQNIRISFTPHLVPMNRGILSTIYICTNTKENDLREFLNNFYKNDTFIKILDKGGIAQTRYVRGSNNCFISITQDRVAGKIIICSVIDNLIKGASGQAVQNMNVRLGFRESEGLNSLAIFP